MDVEASISRGTKRKADDGQAAQNAPKRIKALDQNVVNKIAAGEIIVAPMNALKELMENAVDAGSTSLEIVVKDGGLKFLQITDNGHGIHRDDLSILCERFTTSKLKAFDDLNSIATYGFRGEALASISHIAHLTVTTKTADSSCAWRAHYLDGKLTPAKPGQPAEPKPTAGRGGTQITVEDLFYNIPSRQRAFKSPSDEYAKILDVVGRYAVHCHTVAFSCKKFGDSAMSISVPSNATTVDRIRQIHGSAVANELVELAVSDEKLAFKAIGWITNANYHVKRMALLLFINHRSVESGAMKKAMTSIYSLFLPKGGHPFIYLSLEIDPQRVDVNVHPTKREVNFLNEDDIIGMISRSIQAQLSKVDTSRTFMVQSLLPGAGSNTPNPTRSKDQMSSNRKTTRAPENSLVRTDPSLRKITSMLPSSGNLSDPATSMDLTYTSTDREPIAMRLVTVKELRAEVRNQVHGGLTEVFASHTYVGLVDTARRIVAIQSGVKLYLVDYGMVCNEYFYQIGLTHFANFGVMKFETPLDIKKLINVAVDSEKQTVSPTAGPMQSEPIDWSQIAPRVTAQLVQHREMLLEYFNLDVSQDGQLHSLPLLAKGYMPSLAKLPRFLMRLGPCVDWKDEKGCFHTFLVELASFYTPEQLPQERRKETAGPSDQLAANGHEPSQAEDPEIRLRRDQMARMLEHVLFPAFRARLVATKGLLRGVVEVADLKGLYRVFERC